MWPGYDYWKYMMSEMPSPYSDISQRMIITSSWDEFADMKKQSILEKVGGLYIHCTEVLHRCLAQGSHTALVSFLYEEDSQRAEELGTAWYRSKEVFPQDIPYAGYLTNKKWPLNEVMSLHLIMLQQVRNSVILC